MQSHAGLAGHVRVWTGTEEREHTAADGFGAVGECFGRSVESFEGDSPSASPDGIASGGHFKRRDIRVVG